MNKFRQFLQTALFFMAAIFFSSGCKKENYAAPFVGSYSGNADLFYERTDSVLKSYPGTIITITAKNLSNVEVTLWADSSFFFERAEEPVHDNNHFGNVYNHNYQLSGHDGFLQGDSLHFIYYSAPTQDGSEGMFVFKGRKN